MSADGKPDIGCLPGVVIFFSGTHACMGVAMLPTPALNYWNYKGLFLLFFPWLLLAWIGGTVLLTTRWSRLWARGQWGVVGVAVLFQWAIAAGCFYYVAVATPNDNRFAEAMGSEAQTYWDTEASGDLSERAVVRGRCVVVTRRDDGPVMVGTYCQGKLPRSIRAESPEEVRTVVRTVWRKEPVVGIEGARVDICELTLMDRQTGQLLGRKEFRAEWREVTYKNVGRTWVGHLDSSELTNWLLDLPREP